jgi:hypothetical protein
MQNNFLIGVISSLTATAIVAVMFKWVWPNFKDKYLYNGVRVDGSWDIMEVRNGKQTKVGRIELKQHGRIVTGSSVRSKTREGKKSDRKFRYHGTIHGHQLTLIFDDLRGVGFDTGTYVFAVHNDCKTMIGMATFHGKRENQIVSEARTLLKVLS